jgi:hypothetical protein
MELINRFYFIYLLVGLASVKILSSCVFFLKDNNRSIYNREKKKIAINEQL